MNEDFLLTSLMAIVTAIMFAVIYIVPLAGVITGTILLKKIPQKKVLGLTILLISAAICIIVLIWKFIDIVNFQ